MLKKYVCNRFPNLQIGLKACFQNGYFETDNPEIQGYIERSSSWGSVIFYQDQPEEIEKKVQAENASKQQGGYRTEESHNVARQVAEKIGLDEEETEEMVRARENLVKQAIAQTQQRKRGRPAKVKEQESHG